MCVRSAHRVRITCGWICRWTTRLGPTNIGHIHGEWLHEAVHHINVLREKFTKYLLGVTKNKVEEVIAVKEGVGRTTR